MCVCGWYVPADRSDSMNFFCGSRSSSRSKNWARPDGLEKTSSENKLFKGDFPPIFYKRLLWKKPVREECTFQDKDWRKCRMCSWWTIKLLSGILILKDSVEWRGDKYPQKSEKQTIRYFIDLFLASRLFPLLRITHFHENKNVIVEKIMKTGIGRGMREKKTDNWQLDLRQEQVLLPGGRYLPNVMQ